MRTRATRPESLAFLLFAVVGFLLLGPSVSAAQIYDADPDWIQTGEAFDGGFGYSVIGSADINGDGYDDALVGAPYMDYKDLVAEIKSTGRIYVYLGSPHGLQSEPFQVFGGGRTYEEVGKVLASAGDINGDGFDDILVGSPHIGDYGRVYIYHGSETGLWMVRGIMGDRIVEDRSVNLRGIGHVVAGIGDTNGDGFDDVIVTNNFFNPALAGHLCPTQTVPPQSLVFHGTADGLRLEPAKIRTVDSSRQSYGATASGVGDLNGDGHDDFAVSEPLYVNSGSKGRVHIYGGAPDNHITFNEWSVPAPVGETGSTFGFSLAGAGDVDGDGYGDLLVGEPLARTSGGLYHGKVYLFPGGPNGPRPTPIWTSEGPAQDTSSEGPRYGHALLGVGDFDSDGLDDMIIGSPMDDAGRPDAGRAYICRGSNDGFALGLPTEALSYTAVDQMGVSLSAGDFNGDGCPDLLIGASARAHPGAALAWYNKKCLLNPEHKLDMIRDTFRQLGSDSTPMMRPVRR